MDGLNMSIYEHKAVWGGWQAQCRRRHREVNTPTGVFTPTDVNHMLRRRRRLLATDPLTGRDGISRSIHEFYYIGDRRRSLRPIPIRSTWIGHDPTSIR